MKEKKKLGTKQKKLRLGSYSIFSSLIVIAIAVLVCLFVASLSDTIVKPDISAKQLTAISEQTEQIVSALDQDVMVYVIAQKGSEDQTIMGLLARYTALSDKIKVEVKDPVLNPQFIKAYTQETPSANSLVVECGERNRYVPYTDIFVTDYNSYYTTGQMSYSFNGESEITSAIHYVTNAQFPVVYTLMGHGETALPESLTKAIAKENMEVKELTLFSMTEVPQDADCVMITAPQSDINAQEADMLISYLQGGGRVLLLTGYTETAMENLMKVTAAYGMAQVPGIIMEGDSYRHYPMYPYLIIPEFVNHTVTQPLIQNSYYGLFPEAQGIKTLEDNRETLTVTELAKTSDAAYSKVNFPAEELTYEEGDIMGPFSVASVATEAVGEKEARLSWIAAYGILDDTMNTTVSGANHDFILNVLGWFCEQEESIAIHAKTLTNDTITVPQGTANVLFIVLVVMIPLLILGIGIYYVLVVRRKR